MVLRSNSQAEHGCVTRSTAFANNSHSIARLVRRKVHPFLPLKKIHAIQRVDIYYISDTYRTP